MQSLDETRDGETSTAAQLSNGVYRGLMAFRRSFLLSVSTFGVVLLLAAAYLSDGVVAGMVGVFGVAAILVSVLAYVALWLNRAR